MAIFVLLAALMETISDSLAEIGNNYSRSHNDRYENYCYAQEEQELEDAGLDFADLDGMDYADRAEALEDAGLDPDDYCF